MKKFRPISLSNCAVKIFSKILTNRLSPISDRLISPNQTSFIKGRYILESVVLAHEVIHEVKKSEMHGLVLKLDYEKAYDRVSWEFLFEMLESRGFGTKWISWIKCLLLQSTFSVRINDTTGPYFVGGKGLKQGDPISPILFNLVADVFSKMLIKASSCGLISGLLNNIIPGGVVSLQYADDTLLFLEDSYDKARNFKWILSCFENLSGMKINFHKSNLITINMAEDRTRVFAQIFCCNLGSFPIKYLGAPLHYDKLRKEDLQPLIDRIIKGISGWLGRYLTYRGKIILLCACIVSIPAYLMAVMKFPKWAIKAINSQMSYFLWGNMGEQHKYHLAHWGLVSRKKEFGGLGIPNIREFNMALLASWGKRFFNDVDSDWKKILRYKYIVSNPNILWSRQQGSSPFWKSVTWALNATRTSYKWEIGNGDNINFWHDIWAGDCSLKVRFWNLFEICNQQDCTVSQVWNGTSLRLSFRRCVDNSGMDNWNNLIDFIKGFCMTDLHDKPIWELEPNGIYSVRSFYKFINFGGVVSPIGDSLWKTLCPQNIHVFLWLCLYNKILTRDNVAKRKHLDDLTCLFCNEP
uniref:Reverse transcriptase domain-containing protein n=1 Tax=Hordeum vulgare subsp. vulgare TaxID=112509 RepID=A0A8I6WLN0_HORVV